MISSASHVVVVEAPSAEELEGAFDVIARFNASLDPEGLSVREAQDLFRRYSRGQRLVGCGMTMLASRIDRAHDVARSAGISMGTAKKAIETGKALSESPRLSAAMQAGELSLDQAAVIAPAVQAAPDAAEDLLKTARGQGFHVLRDEARRIKLEAEQNGDLFRHQREARSARTWTDEMGMGHINLVLRPRDYARFSRRAETIARRLHRTAKGEATEAGSPDGPEPFERYLSDAFVALLDGGCGSDRPAVDTRARTKGAEVLVVMSEGVPLRDYSDVRPGEVCKIPGVGPIAPSEAKEVARDAIVSVVTTDGVELKSFKRYSRYRPPELQTLLDAGDFPVFDGVKCIDCGNRFRNEFDHVEPRAAGGPTSPDNMDPRCWPCHVAKTDADRKAGKLRPRPSNDPDPPGADPPDDPDPPGTG